MVEITHAYIEATDGAPKRWMCNSEIYDLAAGEAQLVTMDCALVAQQHFTPTGPDGSRGPCEVKITPFDGPVMLAPVAPPKFTFEETGETFDNQAAFAAHVKDFYEGKYLPPQQPAPDDDVPKDNNGNPLFGAALAAAIKKRADLAAAGA